MLALSNEAFVYITQRVLVSQQFEFPSLLLVAGQEGHLPRGIPSAPAGRVLLHCENSAVFPVALIRVVGFRTMSAKSASHVQMNHSIRRVR